MELLNIKDKATTHDMLCGLSKEILSKIFVVNNDRLYDFDVNRDTVAVGVIESGEIVVAANVKERREPSKISTEKCLLKKDNKIAIYVVYASFGIEKEIIQNIIIDTVTLGNYFQENKLRMVILGDPAISDALTMKEKADTNAMNHAELKILRYSLDIKSKLIVVGSSKLPCTKCHEELTKYNIFVKPEKGMFYVKNWREVTSDEMQIKIIYRQK